MKDELIKLDILLLSENVSSAHERKAGGVYTWQCRCFLSLLMKLSEQSEATNVKLLLRAQLIY